MSGNEPKKCPKCGSEIVNEKKLNLPAGSFDFAMPLKVTAYICDKCGYVELYQK